MEQVTQDAPLMTVGDIAREEGVKLHILKYALDAYRIEPRQRAGILRLWHRDQLPAIRSAIQRVANRREARCA